METSIADRLQTPLFNDEAGVNVMAFQALTRVTERVKRTLAG
jgi:hypothetical protein